MRIEALSLSARPSGSRSRALLRGVVEVLEARVEAVRVATTDIRELPLVLCDGRDLPDYPAAYQQLAARLAVADGVLVATPIYNYSVSGGCRNVLEIVGDSLVGRPVGFLSGSGGRRAHLAVADLMRSLMFEYNAPAYPRTLQLSGDVEPDELPARIDRFALGYADFVRRVGVDPMPPEHL